MWEESSAPGVEGLKRSTRYYKLESLEPRARRLRIFKTRWFAKFARKEKIRDAALVDAVARAEKGQVDADLGGGVIKQRISRPGQGRSGGYRTILFFRRRERAVFAYGFAKSGRANIDSAEEEQFKLAAGHVLGLTERQIEELVQNGDFVEVIRGQEIPE